MKAKRHLSMIYIGIALVLASGLAYFTHYLIFSDPHHIFIYLIGDIAFIPLEILAVAIIVERLMARHERRRIMRKMNMVIGTFFSELGTRLLGRLTGCIENKDALRPYLAIDSKWSARNYKSSLSFVRGFDYDVNFERFDLKSLEETLAAKRDMLVMLLANPNLLEHERFTNMLWAIFHMMEELSARESLDDLPPTDREHLAGDVRRVYALLTVEWLLYCRHLQVSYPYIFSIIVRTHPLQENPSATVK